nr:loricrin-like [Aedes albopictus]
MAPPEQASKRRQWVQMGSTFCHTLNSTSNGNGGASCNNNTANGKGPMLVTPSQCIPPNSGSTLNHPGSVIPIVSPRNTSIPYPLPHHNSTGTILLGDSAQCGIGSGGGGSGIGANAGLTGGGTLPRRTAVGYTGKNQSPLGGSGAGLGGGAHLISPGGNSGGPGGGTIIGEPSRITRTEVVDQLLEAKMAAAAVESPPMGPAPKR